MNDEGYINEKYEDSICWTATNSCNDPERLERRLLACKGAVQYHIEECNPKQVEFFTDAVNHILKKLKRSPEQIEKPGTQLKLI